LSAVTGSPLLKVKPGRNLIVQTLLALSWVIDWAATG
jgi:hypothetical protein